MLSLDYQRQTHTQMKAKIDIGLALANSIE
jgi:hypothetical protein